MPRNRTKNQPIGTAPCPFRGCKETGQVFRYRAQTDNASLQRRAGKLYMRCAAHGVTSDQEWLLENATIDGNQAKPNSSEPKAGASDAPPKMQKPAGVDKPRQSTPAAPKDEPKNNHKPWGFFS